MDGTSRATPKPGGEADLVPVGGSPRDVPNGLIHDLGCGVLIRDCNSPSGGASFHALRLLVVDTRPLFSDCF